MPLMFAKASLDMLIALIVFANSTLLGVVAAGLAGAVLLSAGTLDPGDGCGRLYSRKAWQALGVQLVILIQIGVATSYGLLAYTLHDNDAIYLMVTALYAAGSLFTLTDLRGWWSRYQI